MVAFAIGGAILSAIVPVKAQSNTTDNAAQNMSMDMGGGDTMRMMHGTMESGMTNSSGGP